MLAVLNKEVLCTSIKTLRGKMQEGKASNNFLVAFGKMFLILDEFFYTVSVSMNTKWWNMHIRGWKEACWIKRAFLASVLGHPSLRKAKSNHPDFYFWAIVWGRLMA